MTFQRPTIQKLPSHIANQIAAGEVVERPSAVVKELIENSLDAKATRIEISFEQGGKSYICVNDNGHGMDKANARLSLERHATSKLRSADDLFQLQTFGFRGEALPSIASISEFTLSTKIEEAIEGWEIIIHSGQLIKERPCGKTTGTRIEVKHLFHPVPARRKFLKTDATEAAHIIDLVKLYALAYPQIGFVLRENNKTIFNAMPCQHIRERFESIYSYHSSQDFIEIPKTNEQNTTLHGLIGRPGLTRANRENIITLVNNRPITSRLLTQGILDAYRTFIPQGRYPIVFLFIQIDPHVIDVNIHPTKQEIKFKDEAKVRQIVLDIIKTKLEDSLMNSNFITPADSSIHTAFPFPELKPAPKNPPNPTPLTPFEIREPKTKIQFQEPIIPPYYTSEPKTPQPLKPGSPKNPPQLIQTVDWEFLTYLDHPYILLKSLEGLVILNYQKASQHILYHTIIQKKPQSIHNQKLTSPILLKLNPQDYAHLMEFEILLNQQGFHLSRHHTEKTYWVTEIPHTFTIENIHPFIENLLLDYQNFKPELTHNKNLLYEYYAQIYSKHSAKLEKKPSVQAILSMVEKLLHLPQANRTTNGELIYTLLPPAVWQKSFQM